MFSNCRYPYHNREREAPDNETGSGAARPSGLSLEAGTPAPYAALQLLASGQGNTVARKQYLHGMDSARQQLGNRAFMHWVGLLHAAGHGGQAQADAMQGRQDPAGSAPLQCMPKKRKQKEAAGKVTPEGQTQATPETGAPRVPGASPETPPGAVAQAGAEAAATQPQAQATETAVAGEKKKKKKSRVQVALNTLRAEGVEAFRDYLEARFDETALLDTLVERIKRAQDLAGVRDAALGAVQARLSTLDPMPELVVEGAAAAPVKTSPTVQEAAPDVAQARLRALDPMAVAGLPQASAPDPELVVEGAAITPVKTSPTVQEAAPDVAQARLRALDPMAVAGLPQASAQDPEQIAEDAVTAPVKTSPTFADMALLTSCLRGDAAKLKYQLGSGKADMNMMTPTGTLLYIAAKMNYQEVVKVLLLRPGIKVNLGHPSGATPLSAAAQYGHLEVAGMLLQHPETNPSIGISKAGSPPLAVAAHCGYEKLVKLLLSSGKTNVNLRDNKGGTALYYAAQNNWPKIVDLLIRKGADVNLSLKNRTTPLCVAAFAGYFKVAELLSQAPGVQVDKPGMDNVTPLLMACCQEHKRIVKLLLNNGADPDMAVQYGITALHIACRTGNTKIVELLLNNKADPNIVDAMGQAAIHHVCVAGHAKILKMLLDAGADVDMKAEDEYTPYQFASIAGQQEVMKLLEARSRRPAGPAAQSESLPPAYHMQGQAREERAEQTRPTTSSTALSPQTGAMSAGPTKDGVSAPETAPGSQAGVTGTSSLLEQAKREFRQDILMRLKDERIDSLDGIRLLEAVNGVADLDGLSGIYNRLAGVERKNMRTRSRPLGRKLVLTEGEAKAHEISGFILGDKANLDAGAVEAEIRHYLAPAHHKFISQAVNDMEFGRGKPTPEYPDLLHVSVGIAGVGSCCVFFHVDTGARTIRIAGIGRLRDPDTCRLDYAAAGLQGLRTMRLS